MPPYVFITVSRLSSTFGFNIFRSLYLTTSLFTQSSSKVASKATSGSSSTTEVEENDPDVVRIVSGNQWKQHNLAWYETKLTKLAESRNLAAAIHLVEVEMAKESRIEPSYFILHKMISICAQAGYVQKAMQLLQQMKSSGFQPKSKTYTLMFNACCESPNKALGLEKAYRLRQMFSSDLEQGHLNDLNIASYKAMIRVFGRCGDVHSAFAIMDEAVAKFKQPDPECFGALLHACIQQKEGGFYYAMKVWKQMVEMGVKPNVQLINLVLRSARDCSAVITKAKLPLNQPKPLALPAGSTSSSTDLQPITVDARLTAFGGVQGVIEKCKSLHETPDLKTFSLLVQMCPAQDEQVIFEEIKNSGVKLDINFFNVLIAKMNRQQRFEDARNVVVKLMPEHTLVPDLHTFGSLAMGCFDVGSAKELLGQLANRKMVPSVELFNILIFNSRLNLVYKEFLLKEMSRSGVKPNKISISLVEKALGLAKKALLKEENSRKKAKLTRMFDSFSKFYLDWLRKTPVDLESGEDPFSKLFPPSKDELRKESKRERGIKFVDDSFR